MYIEKIHIDTFGKLADVNIELSSGVNIVEGPNESGKSTLAAFIKFIFYGVPSRERQSVVSWQTGGAAGSITVNDGKKSYRIERALVKTKEAVQLIDCETNMPVRGVIDDATPGELFFGVGADMFEATAFVSQLGGTASGGAKVSEGIENILFSADESVNTQRAVSKLDSARAAILHKNEKGGKLYELDRECAALEVRLADAKCMHAQILTKEAQLADIRARHAEDSKKADELCEKLEQFDTRSLLAQFDAQRKLGAKVAELRGKIEAVANTDIEAVRDIEAQINKLDMLTDEVRDSSEREAATPMPTEDAELDGYISKGGRVAIEAKISKLKLGTWICLAGGALAVLAGAALLFVNVIIGAMCIALGAAALIGILPIRKAADSILKEYDLDALDTRLAARERAEEESKLASIAAASAKKRLDEEIAAVKAEYGCEPSELSERLEREREKLRAAEDMRAQYDKYASVLSQIRDQLRPYSEEELMSKLKCDIDISDVDADTVPTLRREAEFSEKKALQLERQIAELEKVLAGMYPTAEEPTVVSDKLSELKEQREKLRLQHAAYVLASKKLSEASDSLKESVSPRLAADTARLMGHLTGGKYTSFGVGTQLELCTETTNGTKNVDVLSAGTQDAAYLCLRMALVALLYRKELPPMLYDEAFVRQDDSRLASMLKLLHVQGAQSIIFTANSRESDIMRKIGEFCHIKF